MAIKSIVFKTAKEYAEFFDKIPEDKWCVGQFRNWSNQMCAIGHLTKGDGDYGTHHPFRDVLRAKMADASSVNNGYGMFSDLGTTPKQRILNALTLKCAGLWEELCDDFILGCI